MQCNAMRNNTMKCNVMQCDEMQCNGMQYIYLIRCFGVKYRRIFLRVALYSKAPAGQEKTREDKTIQHDAMQCNRLY